MWTQSEDRLDKIEDEFSSLIPAERFKEVERRVALKNWWIFAPVDNWRKRKEVAVDNEIKKNETQFQQDLDTKVIGYTRLKNTWNREQERIYHKDFEEKI